MELRDIRDTEQDLLLDRMKNLLRLTGSVHEWFRSYLSDHSHNVTIGSSMSDSMVIHQGVPQGSLLGPLLFSIHMLPLGRNIRKYGLGYHCYADDTQLYVSTMNSDIHKATSLLASCLLASLDATKLSPTRLWQN